MSERRNYFIINMLLDRFFVLFEYSWSTTIVVEATESRESTLEKESEPVGESI